MVWWIGRDPRPAGGRTLRSAATIALALVLGAACTSVSPGPVAKQDFTVVIAASQEMATFDIHNETLTNVFQQGQMFEGLVYPDGPARFRPALATEWKLTNPTTWEFTLRKGVKFHNGDPFTADDVKWNFDRIMKSEASGLKKFFVGWADRVEIVDEFTVRLHTTAPYPTVLGNMPLLLIMPKNYFEKLGPAEFNKQPVGTGAFKYVAWKVNDSLEYEAYDGYWGGRTKVDHLKIRVIPDESTQIAEMRAGGVDILTAVPPSRVSELRNAGIPIFTQPYITNLYIAFNTHVKPFDDVRVRQAIAHAVDVPTMVKTVLAGYGEVANSLVHKTSFGWDPKLQPFEYDPAKARALLAAAGHPNGFKTTLEAPSTLWPASKEAAEAISGYLGAVGIQAEVQIREFGEFFTRLRENKLQNLYLWGAGASDFDAATTVGLNFRCPPKGRGLYWCLPQVDSLIERAAVNMNPDQRLAEYGQIQQIFRDQVAGVPLWQNVQVAAASKRVKWEPRVGTNLNFAGVVPAAP